MFIEGHYKLPFLSWLPKITANLYLNIFRNESFYYENHLSLKGLKMLVSPFHIVDYTLKIIKDPETYFATDMIEPGSFKHKFLSFISPVFYFFCKTFVWILVKR